MSLKVDTPYAIQNVFTANVVAQLPGGVGPAGFSSWSELLTGTQLEMGSWKLVKHAENAFQISNDHWPDWSIGALPNGYTFITNGGFSGNLVWTILPVEGEPTAYTIMNKEYGSFMYDPAGCGVNGVPAAAAPVYRYNPAKFHWRFVTVS